MPRPKTGLHFYWILESLFKVKKKTLIYSNTFIGLKCSVFMNKHVDVFRINNLQFNYQFYISYQRGVSSFCIVSSNRQKNKLDCTLIHI